MLQTCLASAICSCVPIYLSTFEEYIIFHFMNMLFCETYQVSHAGVDQCVGAVGDEEAGLAVCLEFVEVLKQRVTMTRFNLFSLCSKNVT